MQTVIVYVIVALALGGTCRYLFRKWRALRKSKNSSVCYTCPLKENCTKSQQTESGCSEPLTPPRHTG